MCETHSRCYWKPAYGNRVRGAKVNIDPNYVNEELLLKADLEPHRCSFSRARRLVEFAFDVKAGSSIQERFKPTFTRTETAAYRSSDHGHNLMLVNRCQLEEIHTCTKSVGQTFKQAGVRNAGNGRE